MKIKSDLVKPMVIGFAIGDAMGVPVEFSDRNYLSANPVRDMLGNMKHNQPVGTWSDDTQLTLALIEGLEKEFNLETIANEMIAWMDNGKHTPHGYVFDIGNTIEMALNRIKYENHTALNAGGSSIYENGNGSLMRILPLAFYLKNEPNFEKRKQVIYDVSSITHANIVSKIACHFLVEWTILLLEHEALVSYNKTCNALWAYYRNKYEQFEKILCGNLTTTATRNEIKSTGYVIDTLESVIWCIFHTNSYEEAILTAVNLGGDTDTIGAITGGLAGIIYGYESIPKKWIDLLASKDLLFAAINKLEKF